MKFIIYNSTGKILRTGTAPVNEIENQARSDQDEFVIEGEEINPGKDSIDPVTKTIVPMGRVPDPPPPVDMDYRKARAEVYPPVALQLDMLWHAMDDGQTPKIEPFYSTIKAVKLAYPSDNSVVPGSVEILPGDQT